MSRADGSDLLFPPCRSAHASAPRTRYRSRVLISRGTRSVLIIGDDKGDLSVCQRACWENYANDKLTMNPPSHSLHVNDVPRDCGEVPR